jgi:hypothetical protein
VQVRSQNACPRKVAKSGTKRSGKISMILLKRPGTNIKMQKDLWGMFQGIRRKVADKLAPASNLIKATKKLIPDNHYMTPILGAVELVLDVRVPLASATLKALMATYVLILPYIQASVKSSQVRKEALGSFDDLNDVFSSVGLFLAMFPGDQNIIKASISLTVIILDAIERAIVFFHGSTCKNYLKSIWKCFHTENVVIK